MEDRNKFTRAEVLWESPAKGMDHCEDCLYYQPEACACKLVEGFWKPNDWCEQFSKRP